MWHGSFCPNPNNFPYENNEIWFTEPTRNANCEGIDAVAVKGWVIRGNVIHDFQKSDQGFDGIGWGIFTKGNSQDTLIERNLIYDSFIAISLGGGGTGAQYFEMVIRRMKSETESFETTSSFIPMMWRFI